MQRPGGDAAVVRINDGPKALALTSDVTPRYCEADPFEGGKQAVAEAWRNLTAVGARPLALTDNLNFGNPERPEIMGQFVGCIRGIGEACPRARFPGRLRQRLALQRDQIRARMGRAILPTPTIGGVGLLDDFTKSMTLAFKAEGEAILLIGETRGWLGQSIYLRDICGREDGAPPPVDLAAERRHGDFVRALIGDGLVTAVHDVSDGGLVDRACRNGDGVRHRRRAGSAVATAHPRLLVRGGPGPLCRHGQECRCRHATGQAAAVPVLRLGATGGTVVWRLPASVRCRWTGSNAAFEAWLPAYMAGAV